ncbi:MAG: MBL fold metallo-hydrolase [Myxococcota bacterium]
MAREDQSTPLDFGNFVVWGRAIGGVETCYQVPAFDLNMDIGRCPDGAESQRTLLLTHGHIDHAAGLPYFVSLRSMYGRPPPKIYCPAASRPALLAVLEAWDRLQTDALQCELVGVEPGHRVPLGHGRTALAVPAHHRIETVGWVVLEGHSRLRPDLKGHSEQDIRDRARAGEEVTVKDERPVLCYTGDTTIETLDDPTVRSCRILFIECTFFGSTVRRRGAKFGGHIHLNHLAERAEELKNEQLVLTHVSQRHDEKTILRELQAKLPPSLLERTRVLAPTGQVLKPAY